MDIVTAFDVARVRKHQRKYDLPEERSVCASRLAVTYREEIGGSTDYLWRTYLALSGVSKAWLTSILHRPTGPLNCISNAHILGSYGGSGRYCEGSSPSPSLVGSYPGSKGLRVRSSCRAGWWGHE
jgi:hypothetical protein